MKYLILLLLLIPSTAYAQWSITEQDITNFFDPLLHFEIIPTQEQLDESQTEIDKIKKDLAKQLSEYNALTIQIKELNIQKRTLEIELSIIQRDAESDWSQIPNIEKAKQRITQLDVQLEPLVKQRNQIDKDTLAIQKELNSKVDSHTKQQQALNKKIEYEEINQTLNRIDAKRNKITSIMLSETCIILNEYNSTKCPTYADLWKYDTSAENISGKFNITSHERYDALENDCDWYRTTRPVVIVNPSIHCLLNSGGIIEIVPNFKQYQISESNYTKQYINGKYRGVIETFEFRYTDIYCHMTQLDSSRLDLIPDTVNYLRFNCHENATTYNPYNPIIVELEPVVLSDSPTWRSQQYLASLAEQCKEYRSCTTINHNP